MLAIEEPAFVITGDALNTPRFQQSEGRVGVAQTVDQIAHAQDGIDVHRLQRIEHSLERFGLAVNIADHPQPAEHACVAHSFNLGVFAPRAKKRATGAPRPRVVDPLPCSTCAM